MAGINTFGNLSQIDTILLDKLLILNITSYSENFHLLSVSFQLTFKPCHDESGLLGLNRFWPKVKSPDTSMYLIFSFYIKPIKLLYLRSR